MRFAFGVQKWHKFNNHMDRKHIRKAHKVILSASGTITLFLENKSQVDRLISPVFHAFFHICGPQKYDFCENMNDFEVTNKILYHYANTRFSNGGSVNITVSCWMTDWFLPAGWNMKFANFESKWPKEFFFDWS